MPHSLHGFQVHGPARGDRRKEHRQREGERRGEHDVERRGLGRVDRGVDAPDGELGGEL